MIRQDVRVPIQAAGGDKMSNAKQETLADIVSEMRIGDLCANDTTTSMMYINDFLAGYADRILEMCVVLKLNGKSKRMRIVYGN